MDNVQLEESLSKGWQLCGGGIAPPTQEVSCVIVMGCGMALMSLCVCRGCAVLVVDFGGLWWSVKLSLRIGVLEERDGIFWVCPGPFLLI